MLSPVVDSTTAEVSVRGVKKSFGKTAVLRGVDLDIPAGQRVLLLGSNGAGKSTLLRVLAGLSRADSGAVTRRLPQEPVGYVGHQLLLYRNLTVGENLRFLCGVVGREQTVAEAMIARWNLGDVAFKSIGQLSRGQQFRVAVCRALLTEPRYLFLDEPTSAFDDRSVELLLDEIARCVVGERGGAAVVASHDIARVRSRVDRVVVLHGGALVADSSSSSIDAAVERYREVNR